MSSSFKGTTTIPYFCFYNVGSFLMLQKLRSLNDEKQKSKGTKQYPHHNTILTTQHNTTQHNTHTTAVNTIPTPQHNS